MEVEAQGRRFSMSPIEDGWWSVEIDGVHAGADYAFCIDGGPPRPDPRSPHQPHGVHGPSRVVDHGSFRWTDQGFQAPPLSSALIYELHVGTFTPQGTFDSAVEKLEYLKQLGVTHVELMPVADFPGRFGWGYDGVALFAPRHAYGGPEGLKRLVNACHQRGLAVLLDVVYNHLGPLGNYLSQYGPYFTSRHATPWGEALNFDGPQCDQVRRFFCDNARMWLRDYHIDGLRLDAVHTIADMSAFPFLEQLAVEVEELAAHLGRHLVLVAESDLNDPRLVRSRDAGGFGLDAQWSDDFHHALHTVLTGEREGYYSDFGRLEHLATALVQAYVYAGNHSGFRERPHGRGHVGLSGHRFLGYSQNHDQIGNRATGERLGQLVNLDRLKIAAGLVLTSPFVPMLFQGEEWNATSPFQFFADFAEDPQLARAVAEGRRNEFAAFGWKPEEIPDPRSPETFQRSKLDWDELDRRPHAEVLNWYRRLIQLRRQQFFLTDGRLERVSARYDEQNAWLAIERGPISVLCNLSGQPRDVPLTPGRPSHVLLASKPPETPAAALRLPAESIAILGPDQ
jgi:maltooligosyltrehalose trehalohydrolase